MLHGVVIEPFLLPALLMVLVGAVTGRIWLTLLPLAFMLAFLYGGFSVAGAASAMVVVALLGAVAELILHLARAQQPRRRRHAGSHG